MGESSPEATAEPLDLDPRLPPAGRLETVAAGVRRLVAPNPGALTASGTCSYLLGEWRVVIVDPGPEDHGPALLAALDGAEVAAVATTHTHRDHSPAARWIAAATGAPVIGCAPFRPPEGPLRGLDGAHDPAHRPDRILADGEVFVWRDGAHERRLEALATPGHTANHLCFVLSGEGILLSGDHVMAWSTTVVAPPDGSMGAYLAALERLVMREERLYLPGHGAAIERPQRHVRALLAHRRQREAAILALAGEGVRDVEALVARLYPGLAPGLRGAAALAVEAHLLHLAERGAVVLAGDAAGAPIIESVRAP